MRILRTLKDAAIAAVLVVAIAFFLSIEDIPYAHLKDLNFLGWMAISIGIFSVLAIAHFIFLILFLIVVRLPTWLLGMARKDGSGKGDR